MRSHSSSLPRRLAGRVESSARTSSPNVVVDHARELEAADDLVLDLIPAAEDVRVVLRDVAHAQEPVHRARVLVAVHEALLGQPQRQVAVGVPALVVDLDVARAVHRLEAELAALDLLGQEHLVAVVVPVAGALPEARCRRGSASRTSW